MGFKEIFSSSAQKATRRRKKKPPRPASAMAPVGETPRGGKTQEEEEDNEEEEEEEEEDEKRKKKTTAKKKTTGAKAKNASSMPSLPMLDVNAAAKKGGKKTARSPTAAKTAEKASSVHAKKLKKAKEGEEKEEKEEEMETENKIYPTRMDEGTHNEEDNEELLLIKLSRNMRELKRALDTADKEDDQMQFLGRLRDVETALKAIEVSEDVLAATAAQPPTAENTSANDGEWIGKQCAFFSKCMIRCWNVAVVSDTKAMNVGAAVVSINVREKVLELLTEAKSTCHTKNTTIDEKLLSSLSGKLAETCYNCARFSMAEKYFKTALEGTRFDFDFSEDESPLNEELEEKEEHNDVFFQNFKVASLRGANFIRLNDLSKASSMLTKCAKTLLFANAMSSSSESAKKAQMVSIFFSALEKLARDVEDLDLSSDENGKMTKEKMMDVIKVALENLIEVAETIDESVFPLATKKNMRTRAAKVCVFLNEDASRHLTLVEDVDTKSKDAIDTVEDAQTLLLSAQTSLLSDGNVDYAEKCALRVLGEDGNTKNERFEKTRTLRTFASAAFLLALAKRDVNTGLNRIEKRLRAIQNAKDDECKFALIASSFWAAFSLTSSASSTSTTNEVNESTAIKYAEQLLTPSSLIAQTLTSGDSKESSPLLTRARALAWNHAVGLEFSAEAANRENAKSLAKLAHGAFENVVTIDKFRHDAGFIPENKDSIEFQNFQNDVADALKTRAFCALSASSPSDGSSVALASHAVQALESYESQEMRLVSASTALLRLKLCRAELQNLCCKEKDATLEEEENTTPLGRGEHDNELSDPDTNNKMMIVSRVKNAFHTICRVGDQNAIIFAASELDSLADTEIITKALRSAWEALHNCEKKKLNAPQRQQQKTTPEKQDEENKNNLKNEATVFRAYLAYAWKTLSTGTPTTLDPSKFFTMLASDVAHWLARTAKVPMLLKIFPESLVIIDIVFDLVDLCLKRATIEKSTSSSSSLIDCVRRLSFTAAQLLERVQSLQEYDKETSPASKYRASCMGLTCFQIAIAAMLDEMREDDEKSLSKTEKAVAKFQERIEKAKDGCSGDDGQMKIIRRYEGNLIAYEYAVLNLRMKRKGGTSLSTDEVQAFCDAQGSKVSPRVLLRFCEDYPDDKAAISVINNNIIERITETSTNNNQEAFDGITLAAAFRKLFAAEEQNEKALEIFSRLSTLKPPLAGVNEVILFPTAEAEYLVSLAFNRATHMERLDEPEKALTWVKSIEKVIEKKKDMEAGDETTFLSSSLRPAFVEALAEKLRDAEADLQGEIEVRV